MKMTFTSRTLNAWNNFTHCVTLGISCFCFVFCLPLFSFDEDVILPGRIQYSVWYLVFVCIHACLWVWSCQSTEAAQHFHGTPCADNHSWPENKSWIKLALTPAYINQWYREWQTAQPGFDTMLMCLTLSYQITNTEAIATDHTLYSRHRHPGSQHEEHCFLSNLR